ncbi:spore coat U domain-containing protein [Sphingomonas aracearum]|uniref:Spore coat U domain-containing protein n=1 Tax=Sphingomonas aracearum TaxID=2283317 RepID=A0A369W4Z8_9SPHN|nr:spore coat U domain-containing protein [Sphingomonas aracearum]RDE07131.1 spore coat U domain-containing protein [Sphingomonas aracearum]
MTRYLVVTAGVAVLAGLFGSAPAFAQQTTQFQVTLTIQAECRLTSASDLAFGNTGVIQAAITSTSNIGVQCTNTTPYNIGLNAGAGTGATVDARRMTSGAGATVTYQLFRDAARTQIWGNTAGTNTLAGTGNGAVQTVQVYGLVPAQTTPAAGSYTDTVQVTVTF